MRKMICLMFIILMLLLTSCAAKQEETPAFAVPTPAAEESEPTPAPEPIPTEKPYSEYNQMLDSAEIGKKKASYTVDFRKNDLKELEDASDAIVLATVAKKEVIHDEEELARGTKRGTTVAELILDEVFYSAEDLAAGDVIEMQEFCYLYRSADGTAKLSTTGDYFPVKEYETYLLFLEIQNGYETDGAAKYTPVDLWYGKYPVSTAVRMDERWTIRADEKEVSASVESIFRSIQEKYFADEAVREIIERESEYQKYYGE